MTTPNQPNDERHQTNGVTERIAPSPIPPRPIPRAAAASAEDGPQGGPSGGAQPHENSGQQGDFAPKQAPEKGSERPAAFDQKTARATNAESKTSGDQGNGNGQSQYQDGWAQLPQREPQSNLHRPGQSPVTGRPTAGTGGLGGGATNARTTADLAAKAARKEAAMVKSVGIDGPTRSIARPELIKDMPDLSEIRHPLPQTEATGAQSHISPTVPVAVAAAVTTGEPLRATVQIRRIDPWSTLKISLVISVAMFFVWMLAVGLLYIVLEGMGVWERLNNTFTDMVSQDSGSVGLIDVGTVFGYAGVIGLINVVLFTALGTVATFIYNQCCDLVGGIQVTLADPD
ncbi:DUF3566 domain-containing protein [Nocardia australiensis]|uniref:DUF3566 domain-containing protein n=1 Tax=Nocardia australiensis TaxID=2887191 RepID=UPI001D1524E5|nr:DUF3566 domain-containing protein [Nocardia australiensis]